MDSISWMRTHAGPSFARPIPNSDFVDIFVTGRDVENRSQIGKIRISLKNPQELLDISSEPIFSWGEAGAFDENGVSYPCLIEHNKRVYMLYVGWMPTVITPFQNHIGLAMQQDDGSFTRVSKAPILERTNDDFLSMGSVGILKEKDFFRLYYTSFLSWGTKKNEAKHRYVIKYAESKDLIQWRRDNHTCINIQNDSEFSICRPSIVQWDEKYHMWYSYRGEHYRIGYAHSTDGKNWIRADEYAGIAPSETGFDSLAQAYPHVFQHKDTYYMIYNGNHYGKEGLGLAKLVGAKL